MRRATWMTMVLGIAAAGCGDDNKVTDASDGATTPDTGDTTDAATDANEGDADTTAPDYLLHVPSPDWREQVIYFVFTDRFDDGDPSNDDQGAGEYDPTQTSHYSGGDLQGIINRLDYIQGLGATAVWITPPVANEWWDPISNFGGFHGYWARDFSKVDEHQGTLATYQALSDALHRRGMYLIQDIVANHTGNFFSYSGAYDPDHPEANVVFNTGAKPSAKPTQAPFDKNDVTNQDDRAAAIYHWTPAIADYTDPVQEKTYQTSDLDDLDTENPTVRAVLRQSYGNWIRSVGVDGFRIDTVKFVEHEFWRDFIHGTDTLAPGMHTVGKETGRDDFLTFGEVFETSDPLDDKGDVKATSYLGTDAAPELDAVLGFPLYDEMQRVFGGGRETSLMTYRLGRFMDRALYRDPFITPNFLDNHDVQRFLAQASRPAFEQALVFLFTVPGIPVVFQGTEQGFTETRSAMFAAGWQSGGVDHFDTASELYTLVKSLSQMRRGHPALTRGELTVLGDNPAGPGLLALKRAAADAGGHAALVLFNTADEDILVSGLATGLPEGTRLTSLSAVRGPADAVNVGRAGDLATTVLPARASLVLEASDQTDTVPAPTVTLTVDTLIEGETFTDDVTVTGTVSPVTTKLQLVLDGYVGRAATLTPGGDGHWSGTLPISLLAYGEHPHTLVVYAPEAHESSPVYHFTSHTTFDGVVQTLEDPIGDDTGPTGNYTYPQDATFAGGKSMDVERLVVETGPKVLRLKLTMGEHSTVWNPSNGFDHVAFTIYFDVPGVDGVTLLPLINGAAPDGFAWDFTHFAFGWSNSLYKSLDASPTSWGTATPGRPSIAVDAPTRTIIFEYDAAKIGLAAWTDTKVYITTWDFDGIDARYRPMAPEGGQWIMGGGEATDPYIMDDVGPITLPAAQ